jgi:hypothetical protein
MFQPSIVVINWKKVSAVSMQMQYFDLSHSNSLLLVCNTVSDSNPPSSPSQRFSAGITIMLCARWHQVREFVHQPLVFGSVIENQDPYTLGKLGSLIAALGTDEPQSADVNHADFDLKRELLSVHRSIIISSTLSRTRCHTLGNSVPELANVSQPLPGIMSVTSNFAWAQELAKQRLKEVGGKEVNVSIVNRKSGYC